MSCRVTRKVFQWLDEDWGLRIVAFPKQGPFLPNPNSSTLFAFASCGRGLVDQAYLLSFDIGERLEDSKGMMTWT